MILGHERQIEYLEKVLKNGRISHAYLFYGPEHVGKLAVAKALVKALYCNQGGAISRVCEECDACRAVEAGSHPHVVILDSEHTLVSKKEKRKDIPIDDIKELKRRFSYAPEGNKWRVAIINHAERMSGDAANAFLKLLEEPGAQTLFILLTSARELVFPTISSRAQPLRFSLVPNTDLEEFAKLKVRNAEERRELLMYAEGRPGILCTFLENKDTWESERKFARAFESALRGGAPEIFHFTGKIAQDEELRGRTLEYVMRLLRKSFISHPSPGAARRIKKIDTMATLLQTTNVNPRLALDIILLTAMPD